MKWMKMGRGADFKDERNSIPFFINISNRKKTEKFALDIAVETVKRISQTYPAPYTLFLSGGVDSQAMLWAWHNSGISFNSISVIYRTPGVCESFNYHDLTKLDEFSSTLNITVDKLFFDVIRFLEEDLMDYATTYECTSPQICTYMRMSELISDGTILFSGDITGLSTLTYTILGLKRYADKSRSAFIPFFFMHDPELYCAVKPELIGLNTVNKERINGYSVSAYKNKCESYRKNGFPVMPQEIKFSGFEKIKDFYDSRTNLVSFIDRLQYAHKPSKRIFDIHFRYKLERKINYNDRLIVINQTYN